MKGRTADEFLDCLDQEFGWRLKELSDIHAAISSPGDMSRTVRLRTATAMLYAHWEGFVKGASEAYVDYVARRRLKHFELNDGFLSLAMKSKLKRLMESDDVTAQIEFVRYVRSGFDSRAQIPRLGVIKTGANLNSHRLKAIISVLCLDYGPFELKENLIDRQLLEWRNSIAHGRGFCPNEDEFELLYRTIMALLRVFKDQIVNAAISGRYRRPT